MPPDRVQVLPPGVDTERFRPGLDGSPVRADAGVAPDAPLVALIARFQDVKGHDVFQAMARQVAQAMPEARFIVAGENMHGNRPTMLTKRASSPRTRPIRCCASGWSISASARTPSA